MCRDISKTSDTITTTQKTYKLPENIPRNGGGGLVIRRPSSDLPDHEEGEGMYLTSPNSPPKNRGGEELTTPIFPNSPRGGEEGEGENIISPNSPNENDELNNDISSEFNSDDPSLILNTLRTKNRERIIVGHLNINHIEKKFEPLASLVKDRLDIFLFSETKIDSSFPPSQFAIKGYSNPFRKDRDVHGGGLLLYVRDDIPCKEVKLQPLPNNFECLFIEIKLRKKKYILVAGYNPHRDTISYFLTHVGNTLDKLLGDYDNILILGDFNSSLVEPSMRDFCETYNLENLIKEPTCFKNVNNPSLIDVMLTNRENSFHNSMTIETGLSDHHKMTISILKTFFKKKESIKINYRCYKNLIGTNFRNDLSISLQHHNHEYMEYENFHDIFMTVLDSHAPTKKRVVRGNNQPFMNKVLSKAFMQRSKLKNLYNKYPTEVNKTNYKQQRNFCVGLLQKEKKKYYNNLDLKILDDNKKFWKSIKPLFSNKHNVSQKNIVIVEIDTITSKNEEVADKLNNFFIKAVEDLEIEQFAPNDINNAHTENIEVIIKRYERHPSILRIKGIVNTGNKTFTFTDTTPDVIKDEISKLDPKKASVQNDIPTKILIGSQDIVCDHLSNIYNNSKSDHIYPQALKLSDVIPIHKKEETTLMKSYRAVSLIPVVSKLFERDMYNQILSYIDVFLSPYLFGYRKGYSTEQCLTAMLEQWKKALDNRGTAGAILTDLSKAFDCLNYNLLLAKMEAYGFDKSALEFIQSYLKGRKQRTKVNDSFSLRLLLKKGVPQGSILGPLLFNIFLNDMFYFLKDTKMANYADDNTVYTNKDNINDLLNTLENETCIVIDWLRNNEMKPNNDKCHLIVCNHDHLSVRLGKEKIESTDSVELLGVVIDNNLNFTDHVSRLCRISNQKLHALARISKYLNEDKLRIIMKTFIQSQFNYCPLVWMFHSRTLNNKINKLHERALRIVYKKDFLLTFQELLNKDDSVTTHHRNLQKLATEMYKVKNQLSPLPIQELFTEKIYRHDLRNKRSWESSNMRTVKYGTQTVRNMGPKTWDLVPTEIKESKSLCEFKKRIKRWKPNECTCRVCKTYICGLGFLDD